MNKKRKIQLLICMAGVALVVAIYFIRLEQSPLYAYEKVVKELEAKGVHKEPDGSFSMPANAQPANPLMQNPSEVVEHGGGFAYVLPTGWTLKKVPGMTLEMPFGREQDGNPANISFQDATFNGNLAEFESNILKGIPATFATLGINNFTVVSMSAFETNTKLMGLQAVAQAQRQDGKIVQQLYYFFDLKEGKKVCAVCSVADEGTTYDADFTAIMKTFRVNR